MKLLSVLLEQVSVSSISAQGLDDLMVEEGFKPYVYADKGKWAIGYGTQVNPADYKDEDGNPIEINKTRAKSMLVNFLKNKIYPEIKSLEARRKKPFLQNQFDALCSILYNLGPSGLKNTNLESAIIARRRNDVITHWSTGWKDDELIPRRKRELSKYLGDPLDKIFPADKPK